MRSYDTYTHDEPMSPRKLRLTQLGCILRYGFPTTFGAPDGWALELRWPDKR